MTSFFCRWMKKVPITGTEPKHQRVFKEYSWQLVGCHKSYLKHLTKSHSSRPIMPGRKKHIWHFITLDHNTKIKCVKSSVKVGSLFKTTSLHTFQMYKLLIWVLWGILFSLISYASLDSALHISVMKPWISLAVFFNVFTLFNGNSLWQKETCGEQACSCWLHGKQRPKIDAVTRGSEQNHLTTE